jgi:hypothetical protein
MPRVKVDFKPIELDIPDNIYQSLSSSLPKHKRLAEQVVANMAKARMSLYQEGGGVDLSFLESIKRRNRFAGLK